MSRDVYQEVTDRIIQSLEQGVAPWVKPWKNNPAAGALPFNATTNRHYNGVNVLLLWVAAEKNGFTSPGWMTFKQAKDIGANVKKGSKGTQIVFWNIKEYADEKNPDDVRKVPLLRCYTVFNLDQIENLSVKYVRPELPAPAETPAGIEHVEAFIQATQATIEHGGNRAFYRRSDDLVRLPARDQFKSLADYYATTLHELTHWTGHESRLNRTFGQRFGDETYAAEELVAEMGAAFTCAALGIEGKLQHESYIASWLRVLKNDKRAIFTAAKMATQAAEFLQGLQQPKLAIAA